MLTYPIARRFRARARATTVGCLVGAVVVIVGGAVAIAATGGPRNGILVAYLAAVLAIVAMLVAFAAMTTRQARALRTLAARHPAAAVCLGRRLPPVVSDMPAFLRGKGFDVVIGDGWYPIVADARGIAVHSASADPRELVLMEWSEIGEVQMVRTATVGGDSRWSVTVDVQPYDVPLTADIGDAWGIVTMALDAADTTAMLKAILAQRPTFA